MQNSDIIRFAFLNGQLFYSQNEIPTFIITNNVHITPYRVNGSVFLQEMVVDAESLRWKGFRLSVIDEGAVKFTSPGTFFFVSATGAIVLDACSVVFQNSSAPVEVHRVMSPVGLPLVLGSSEAVLLSSKSVILNSPGGGRLHSSSWMSLSSTAGYNVRLSAGSESFDGSDAVVVANATVPVGQEEVVIDAPAGRKNETVFRLSGGYPSLLFGSSAFSSGSFFAISGDTRAAVLSVFHSSNRSRQVLSIQPSRDDGEVRMTTGSARSLFLESISGTAFLELQKAWRMSSGPSRSLELHNIDAAGAGSISWMDVGLLRLVNVTVDSTRPVRAPEFFSGASADALQGEFVSITAALVNVSEDSVLRVGRGIAEMSGDSFVLRSISGKSMVVFSDAGLPAGGDLIVNGTSRVTVCSAAADVHIRASSHVRLLSTTQFCPEDVNDVRCGSWFAVDPSLRTISSDALTIDFNQSSMKLQAIDADYLYSSLGALTVESTRLLQGRAGRNGGLSDMGIMFWNSSMMTEHGNLYLEPRNMSAAVEIVGSKRFVVGGVSIDGLSGQIVGGGGAVDVLRSRVLFYADGYIGSVGSVALNGSAGLTITSLEGSRMLLYGGSRVIDGGEMMLDCGRGIVSTSGSALRLNSSSIVLVDGGASTLVVGNKDSGTFLALRAWDVSSLNMTIDFRRSSIEESAGNLSIVAVNGFVDISAGSAVMLSSGATKLLNRQSSLGFDFASRKLFTSKSEGFVIDVDSFVEIYGKQLLAFGATADRLVINGTGRVITGGKLSMAFGDSLLESLSENPLRLVSGGMLQVNASAGVYLGRRAVVSDFGESLTVSFENRTIVASGAATLFLMSDRLQFSSVSSAFSDFNVSFVSSVPVRIVRTGNASPTQFSLVGQDAVCDGCAHGGGVVVVGGSSFSSSNVGARGGDVILEGGGSIGAVGWGGDVVLRGGASGSTSRTGKLRLEGSGFHLFLKTLNISLVTMDSSGALIQSNKNLQLSFSALTSSVTFQSGIFVFSANSSFAAAGGASSVISRTGITFSSEFSCIRSNLLYCSLSMYASSSVMRHRDVVFQATSLLSVSSGSVFRLGIGSSGATLSTSSLTLPFNVLLDIGDGILTLRRTASVTAAGGFSVVGQPSLSNSWDGGSVRMTGGNVSSDAFGLRGGSVLLRGGSGSMDASGGLVQISGGTGYVGGSVSLQAGRGTIVRNGYITMTSPVMRFRSSKSTTSMVEFDGTLTTKKIEIGYFDAMAPESTNNTLSLCLSAFEMTLIGGTIIHLQTIQSTSRNSSIMIGNHVSVSGFETNVVSVRGQIVRLIDSQFSVGLEMRNDSLVVNRSQSVSMSSGADLSLYAGSSMVLFTGDGGLSVLHRISVNPLSVWLGTGVSDVVVSRPKSVGTAGHMTSVFGQNACVGCGSGGGVLIAAGSGDSAVSIPSSAGGVTTVSGGNGFGLANGGDVVLLSGNATTVGSAGNIVLVTGAGQSGALHGSVRVKSYEFSVSSPAAGDVVLSVRSYGYGNSYSEVRIGNADTRVSPEMSAFTRSVGVRGDNVSISGGSGVFVNTERNAAVYETRILVGNHYVAAENSTGVVSVQAGKVQLRDSLGALSMEVGGSYAVFNRSQNISMWTDVFSLSAVSEVRIGVGAVGVSVSPSPAIVDLRVSLGSGASRVIVKRPESFGGAGHGTLVYGQSACSGCGAGGGLEFSAGSGSWFSAVSIPSGGDIVLRGGEGQGQAFGGNVFVTAGNASSAVGGSVYIESGYGANADATGSVFVDTQNFAVRSRSGQEIVFLVDTAQSSLSVDRVLVGNWNGSLTASSVAYTDVVGIRARNVSIVGGESIEFITETNISSVSSIYVGSHGDPLSATSLVSLRGKVVQVLDDFGVLWLSSFLNAFQLNAQTFAVDCDNLLLSSSVLSQIVVNNSQFFLHPANKSTPLIVTIGSSRSDVVLSRPVSFSGPGHSFFFEGQDGCFSCGSGGGWSVVAGSAHSLSSFDAGGSVSFFGGLGINGSSAGNVDFFAGNSSLGTPGNVYVRSGSGLSRVSVEAQTSVFRSVSGKNVSLLSFSFPSLLNPLKPSVLFGDVYSNIVAYASMRSANITISTGRSMQIWTSEPSSSILLGTSSLGVTEQVSILARSVFCIDRFENPSVITNDSALSFSRNSTIDLASDVVTLKGTFQTQVIAGSDGIVLSPKGLRDRFILVIGMQGSVVFDRPQGSVSSASYTYFRGQSACGNCGSGGVLKFCGGSGDYPTSSASGGVIILTGGDGRSSASGGAIVMRSGNSSSANGGSLDFQTGFGLFGSLRGRVIAEAYSVALRGSAAHVIFLARPQVSGTDILGVFVGNQDPSIVPGSELYSAEIRARGDNVTFQAAVCHRWITESSPVSSNTAIEIGDSTSLSSGYPRNLLFRSGSVQMMDSSLVSSLFIDSSSATLSRSSNLYVKTSSGQTTSIYFGISPSDSPLSATENITIRARTFAVFQELSSVSARIEVTATDLYFRVASGNAVIVQGGDLNVASGKVREAGSAIVPSGAILFFSSSCPSGFTEFVSASGRAIFGPTTTYPVGTILGSSLTASFSTFQFSVPSQTVTVSLSHGHSTFNDILPYSCGQYYCGPLNVHTAGSISPSTVDVSVSSVLTTSVSLPSILPMVFLRLCQKD
eukprot:ANDGO_02842.mRNA.1 hypothetical protein